MGSYLVIIAVLIIFFCIRRRRRTAAVAWQILNQRKQNKENVVMKELAKQFYWGRMHHLYNCFK